MDAVHIDGWEKQVLVNRSYLRVSIFFCPRCIFQKIRWSLQKNINVLPARFVRWTCQIPWLLPNMFFSLEDDSMMIWFQSCVSFTLSPIIDVESGCVWKVNPIGDTPTFHWTMTRRYIFHFHPYDPIWPIFFRWVEATNQLWEEGYHITFHPSASCFNLEQGLSSLLVWFWK